MTTIPILALIAIAAVTVGVFLYSSHQGPGVKWPWTGRSGLAKATTTFATALLVSTGLCGANIVASQLAVQAAPIWLFLGVVELTAMALSALGLLLVLVIWVFRRIWRSPTDGDQ